ncbi:formin-binding protein 1-like, partial [Protobothrops mucrosquamatus]|uniref:formin-binding protein 1-like n=1 Tax=Protobothrops mucrosquamatus TaxID=103944 RepID=UPI000775F208
NLVKKYCPKRSSKDEEPRFTSCIAFYNILNELNDYAGQREVVAEELGHRVYGELMRYSHELKTERKLHLQEGRKAQQYLDMCWKQMDNSKKKFERECKEAEKAQQCYEKLDNDTNATKADVEKAKQQLNLRTHMADENKNEYAAQLQNFNGEQHKHFYIVIPQIYKDSQIVIDSFKSGFEPPGDFPFEDYSQHIYRTVSDGTISTPKQEGMKIDAKTTVGKAKGKLWLFGKKPKPQSPPLTPTSLYTSSTSNGSQYPIFSIEQMHYCMNEIKTGKPRMPSFKSLKRGWSMKTGPSQEDFSHLPPEQRRKKLQQRIDELNRELQKETDQKDALIKMKDVYEKNPQMGDPGSLQPKLMETMNNMDRLRMEIHKNEVKICSLDSFSDKDYPEGSYTDDANQEVRSPPQQHGPHNEFDDEFEDDDPLPAIGHCKAIYPFD